MGVPAGYELSEPGFGFKQLGAQPKATSGGSGQLFGDLVVWDATNNVWAKVSGAAQAGRFGVIGNTTILAQSTNNITGAVTYTRGTADADTTCSVITAGRIIRVADGAIPGGRQVVTTATGPLDKVKTWDGVTAANTIVGTYVLNITQHHDMDAPVPAAANNDIIVIDLIERTS